MESFNGLYKWELIYPRGTWQGLSDVEFATLEYVDWFNHRRLHGEITDGPGYTTPTDFEADYYRSLNIPTDPGGDPNPRVSMKPGAFQRVGSSGMEPSTRRPDWTRGIWSLPREGPGGVPQPPKVIDHRAR